ncbi:hypothetical protein [Sphingomonas carotinifaciens]|uniref:hypothetical protein n=1 Tax=Sphingomonas carotinifaciens TaxID=1166323 RepID=UPI001C499B9B|nr:hypothetical protein [Sphingomonas carotinifaciens]
MRRHEGRTYRMARRGTTAPTDPASIPIQHTFAERLMLRGGLIRFPPTTYYYLPILSQFDEFL